MDLYQELQGTLHMLNKACEALPHRIRAHAKAEQDYRVKLRQKILLERDSGTPVTIISDLCRGDEDVARAKMERDIAEGMYKSVLEAINNYKLQARLLESQIEREWGKK